MSGAIALVACAALAGCGSGAPAPGRDGASATDQSPLTDLAALPDLAPPPDLAALPDLSSEGDLASPPDLASPVDLAGVDQAMALHCNANFGYLGMGSCGEGGTCFGMKFTLDCAQGICVCAINGQKTQSFPQLQVCSMGQLDAAWKNGCMF